MNSAGVATVVWIEDLSTFVYLGLSICANEGAGWEEKNPNENKDRGPERDNKHAESMRDDRGNGSCGSRINLNADSGLINNFVNRSTWPGLQCNPVSRRGIRRRFASLPRQMNGSPASALCWNATRCYYLWEQREALIFCRQNKGFGLIERSRSRCIYNTMSYGMQNGFRLKLNMVDNKSTEQNEKVCRREGFWQRMIVAGSSQ